MNPSNIPRSPYGIHKLFMTKTNRAIYCQFWAVLRIRGVYPESRIRCFSIPDPFFFHRDPGSASKNWSILTQKMVSKFSEIWSWLFIPDPDPDFLLIPDPGSRGQEAPDPGFRIRIRNTDFGVFLGHYSLLLDLYLLSKIFTRRSLKSSQAAQNSFLKVKKIKLIDRRKCTRRQYLSIDTTHGLPLILRYM